MFEYYSSLVMTDVGINGQQGPEFPVEAQRCFLARTNWSEVIDRDAWCREKKNTTEGEAFVAPSSLKAQTVTEQPKTL